MNKGYDIMVGSRYKNGTISVIGWEFRRLLMSKFGNFYASKLMGLPYTDVTSGFRCYTRKALESIDLSSVSSNGYAFQIEMIYLAKKVGLRIGEMSITFYERNSGSSKMSKKILREAVFLPWRLKLRAMKNFLFSKN
jgi:dolichol-phosphate mannosyltransferase